MKILFFAQLEESVGDREIELSIDSISIKELKQQLRVKYPNLPLLENIIVAVNEEYADDATLVSENDVVAFIPPVSGG